MKLLTYLINLDGSHARLEQASQQLEQAGMPFTRFAAVDGRGKPLAEFKNYNDAKANAELGRSMLNAEIGCYLSHKGCVEQFLKSDADYLLVLEDDIQLMPQFKNIIDSIINYLNNHKALEWHVINIAAKKKKMAKDIVTIGEQVLAHAYYFPIRTVGLVWSRAGAQAFLKQHPTIYLPIDVTLQNWLSQNGKGLSVWPALVKPRGLDSEILGTVTQQGVQRKDIEQRGSLYQVKKQKRMWRNRYYALSHLMF